MPKKIIKKYIPDSEQLKQVKSLQFLGDRLHEPNLWHLNRRSVSLAFLIGMFVMWIPVPGQMIIAAILAFYCRANLPVSIALVWITNPLTMPPMFYAAYVVGLKLLAQDAPGSDFEFSVESVSAGLGDIGGPFLLGCLVLGVLSSLLGYFAIGSFWKYHVAKQWKARSKR